MVCAALNLGRGCIECIQQTPGWAQDSSPVPNRNPEIPNLLSPIHGRKQCFKTYERWIFVYPPSPSSIPPSPQHSQSVPVFNGIITPKHLPGFCKNLHFTENNNFSNFLRAGIIPARLEPDLPVVPIMGCVTQTITQLWLCHTRSPALPETGISVSGTISPLLH